MANKFSHLDEKGDPAMVDVSNKEITTRLAKAQSVVVLPQEIIEIIQKDEIHTKKGPVFQTAILAGIMGAKKTSDLIPLCHPLPISKCDIDISISENQQVIITCEVKTSGKTGVEMEALCRYQATFARCVLQTRTRTDRCSMWSDQGCRR